jgi:dephospho-CoA kinase
MPLDKKTEYADFVIYNDKSREDTRKQVEDIWQALVEIRKEKAG